MINRPDRDRRVIPRWRSAQDHARRPEGQPLPRKRRVDQLDMRAALEARLHDWERHGHHIYASDLVTAAVPIDAREQVEEAARSVVASADASTLARVVAQRFLDKNAPTYRPPDPAEDAPTQKVQERLRGLKRRLYQEPANALVQVELARQYALLGQGAQAETAMKRAVALASTNRYILRSAARLWIHLDNPERAHALLAKAARTRRDPWLLAAEIATASVAGRTSNLVSTGREMLDKRDLPPAHLTELASSLATLELEGGGVKRARRLFESSLLDPNDNALAQAEWASARVQIPGLDERLDTVPESYEARALDAAADARPAEATSAAWLWLADEPFSTEPPAFGSYEASKAGDFRIGARFAERGLLANPHSTLLLNNLAFCYAKLDEVDAATEKMERIERIAGAELKDPAVIATKGLIALRRGDFDTGHALYLKAITEARDAETKFIAAIMYAVEATRFNRDAARDTARVIDETADKASREARLWLRHLETTQPQRH